MNVKGSVREMRERERENESAKADCKLEGVCENVRKILLRRRLRVNVRM